MVPSNAARVDSVSSNLTMVIISSLSRLKKSNQLLRARSVGRLNQIYASLRGKKGLKSFS